MVIKWLQATIRAIGFFTSYPWKRVGFCLRILSKNDGIYSNCTGLGCISTANGGQRSRTYQLA